LPRTRRGRVLCCWFRECSRIRQKLLAHSDHDETGFRVVEYGKSRKIVLPDKREIEQIKLRELMRRGIGQHTIEKALHAHVRVNTYRKIVAAIAKYKQEKPARV
jgi:hypothetical protein